MIRIGLGLALACAACVRYQPRPIDPTTHTSEVFHRDLGDSVLLAAVTRHAGRPAANRWTDRQLALAALTMRSDLRRLRAEWRVAEAAVRTAGERPGIGVQGEVERRVGGREVEDPWVVGVAGAVRLELGGKRGARQQAARAGVTLAESHLVASSRAVAVETRLAAAALVHALADAADATEEVRALEKVHALEQSRFAEAALDASELARTSTEIQNARLDQAEAEHAVLTARAVLAGTMALPTRSLDSVVPVLDQPGGCASLDSIGLAAFTAGAVQRRTEVATALAEYAVSESRLRLEVARQFPDLELGPGFVWDEGVHRWALAFALPALLGSRNRGAILEADAARDVAGLHVAEVQDSVLADADMAVQGCLGAYLELAAADSVVAAAERLHRRESDAYERGETSRLEPARAELQLLRARRARRAAERRLALASLELERAAGGPPSTDGQWPDPRQDPKEEESPPWRPRVLIVLLLLLAGVAAVVILRPVLGNEQEEEADGEAPIVAPSRVAESEGEPRVVLDSAEVERIGLRLAALAPATAQGGRRLSGQVIPEPERTVTVRAPVAGKLTVAQGGRWPSLGERLQAGAPLGRVSDAQPLSVPIAGAVTAVGARPGEIVEAGQMLLELADNSHPVVRVAWPAEAGRPADRVMLLPAGGTTVEAALIGPAPEADPLTRQPAYLYRSRARWPGAVPGTPVTASVADGAKVEGALVPDGAVVQWEGLAWVYLRRGSGEYARVRVSTDQPAPGGWVVRPPLAPGDSVVVTGVQELLSEEFRARVTVGEESGE